MPAVSPDGKQVAFVRHKTGTGDGGVWIGGLEGGPGIRCTSSLPKDGVDAVR